MECQKVQVWIYTKLQGKLKFLVLFTNPRRGGFWQPVTGKVEADETLAKAALREAHEETGLQFQGEPEPIDYHFSFEALRGKRERQIEEYGFLLRARMEDSETAEVTLSDEHSDWKWVGYEEAFKLLRFSSNQEMLKHALDLT